VQSGKYRTKKEARAAWNRRAGAQSTAEPPTEKGWYWYESDANEPTIVYYSGFWVRFHGDAELDGVSLESIEAFRTNVRWCAITPPLPGKEDEKDE